jgi:hypothetical protein
VSQGQWNFIVGISLLLVAILLIGCLPNKQGRFTCICVPVISKIRSMLPGQKPKPPDVAPTQIPSTPSAAIPDNAVNWWKDQPDLKQEETAINAQISGLSSAFAAKNVEGALNYFAPSEKDKYRQILSQSPDMMPIMANDLKNARISFLSTQSDQYGRGAEYAITVEGQTLYIKFTKVDGQWMLQTF